jgi:hypothetical protein
MHTKHVDAIHKFFEKPTYSVGKGQCVNFPRHTSILFREMQASYFFKCCQTMGSPRPFFPVFLFEIHPFKTHGHVISYFRVCLSTSHLLHVTTSSCLIAKSLRLAKCGCFHSDLYLALRPGKCPMSHPKLCLNLCHREIKRIQIISVFYILTFRGWTVRTYLRNCQLRPKEVLSCPPCSCSFSSHHLPR